MDDATRVHVCEAEGGLPDDARSLALGERPLRTDAREHVATLAALADGLMAHGRDASTPVAVVERAYASDQRVTTATLGTIATTAQDAGVANPAVIVIGDVVDVPGLVADRTLTTVGA